MVVLPLAPIAGLMLVTAHITNPALSPAVFNKWYSDVHVKDMLDNKFASIALRYSNYTVGSAGATPTFTLASNYLALYNTPDINFVNVPGNMDKLPLTSPLLPDKNKSIMTWSEWKFTYWLPTQTFEGNSTATERPKYVLTYAIEPVDDKDMEDWYQQEV